MEVVTDKGGAIALMIFALCALGTWPAIFNLLERRGRSPVHTFLDYTITNYLIAIIIAFTLGQIGPSTPEAPNFLTQLGQDNGASVGFAMAGGVFLFIGNICTQYALALCGLSVTETVMSSITVVMGTTFNYFLDGRINNAAVLFPGVGCFLLAVFVGSATHASNTKDIDEKLGIQRKGGYIDKSLARNTELGKPGYVVPLGMENNNLSQSADDIEKGGEANEKAAKPYAVEAMSAATGSAEYLQNVEDRRAIKVAGSSFWLGLGIVLTGGVSFGVFSPAFNLATNDQWHKLPQGVPHLVVYTAFFYFSTAFFAASFIVNLIFLYKPPLGLPKSSLKAWICDNRGRLWAYVAGILCGLGNGAQFMGGQAAGYAAADSVQALPLVSTFWGIACFGEYRRSSKRTYLLLGCMLLLFAAAVGLLMGSSGHRKSDS